MRKCKSSQSGLLLVGTNRVSNDSKVRPTMPALVHIEVSMIQGDRFNHLIGRGMVQKCQWVGL
jgi:hypothetical protein